MSPACRDAARSQCALRATAAAERRRPGWRDDDRGAPAPALGAARPSSGERAAPAALAAAALPAGTGGLVSLDRRGPDRAGDARRRAVDRRRPSPPRDAHTDQVAEIAGQRGGSASARRRYSRLDPGGGGYPIPMAKLTADFILERLAENGVKRIYGYPGDGINAIVGALERQQDIEFVQVRHEEMAAFMACAHAKWTGEVGVCLATSRPGAIHLLNGLYHAKLDHAPVLAIVGQQSRMALGGSYQQEVDLQVLFKDVAHEYCETALVPEQIRHLVDRAHRIALDQRTVTCIIVPNDLAEEKAVLEPPQKPVTI